jgi:hypothetical protein
MKATMKKATVVVCLIPVDFQRGPNIATSPLPGNLRNGIRSPDLVQVIREWAESAQTLIILR